jgi:hypothetical protein
MARQGSGTGQGGKSFQDRELAARVRTLSLTEIEHVLKNRKHKLYGPVLIKLAGSVLPRLNEHTGEDGGPIQITGVKVTLRK